MQDFLGIGSHLLASASESGGGEVEISFLGLFVYFIAILIFLWIVMGMARKGFNNRVFSTRPARWFEQLYLFIENMVLGVVGPHGRKYIPMILTFWVVIFLSNVVALFMPFGPTADVGFNLGMALVSIMYVQYEGMKTNGILGHFRHFAGPSLPVFMAILITPIIFSIEIVSELMKNVSLSLRLYGNIHGGHEAVSAMNKLAEPYFPVGALLLPIKLLTCVVQAMVFTLLTCVYLSLVTSHHDDHGDEHGHHDEAGMAPAH